MKAILILVHGSKRIETEQVVQSIVEKVKAKTGNPLVAAAFLQFSEINLEKGIDRLVEEGATDISVMPMFLFDGVHVTQDIPNELEEIRKKYPAINLTITRHIGDDDRIADIVIDRVNKG